MKFFIADYVVEVSSQQQFKIIDYVIHLTSNRLCYVFQSMDGFKYVLSQEEMEDGRFAMQSSTERVG